MFADNRHNATAAPASTAAAMVVGPPLAREPPHPDDQCCDTGERGGQHDVQRGEGHGVGVSLTGSAGGLQVGGIQRGAQGFGEGDAVLDRPVVQVEQPGVVGEAVVVQFHDGDPALAQQCPGNRVEDSAQGCRSRPCSRRCRYSLLMPASRNSASRVPAPRLGDRNTRTRFLPRNHRSAASKKQANNGGSS
jgi:hypothetical protein